MWISLAAVSEKGLQEFRATAREDASADFHAVIELRVVYHLQNRMYGAGLGIVCAVDQALDASVHQSAGAHRARLDCYK